MILLGLCTLLLDSRYLELRFQEWWHLIVPKYDDIRFKKNYGNGFPKLTNLITNIESHSIFQSTGNRQQVPVELQLAIFLRRGSKDEIFSIRSHYGISEGTVYLYCKRVMLAILLLKSS
ncbi:uncharacterized protein OCT59_017112 [Rhizophagus irregularis]|uniref:uncharacterized protein n=1 Tax=Rhizophagus irregularis TaxID=588596 RepID=UPI0033280E8B|nr:hypothetical protein OCT59_017112 [Rhizophagus irregularis]